jgi:hypothetical protein
MRSRVHSSRVERKEPSKGCRANTPYAQLEPSSKLSVPSFETLTTRPERRSSAKAPTPNGFVPFALGPFDSGHESIDSADRLRRFDEGQQRPRANR